MEFADHLRRAMNAKNMSSRKLAKAWHPESPESYRRSIMRYLSGKVTPTPEVRDQLAAALGVSPEMLPLAVDNRTVADMTADLMARLEVAIARLEQFEPPAAKKRVA